MNHDTTCTGAGSGDVTLPLDLDGLAVTNVERTGAGARLVTVGTAEDTVAACPTCGVLSTAVKEYGCTRPRDPVSAENCILAGQDLGDGVGWSWAVRGVRGP